jgi:uncharacterized delta-60 repeat protein
VWLPLLLLATTGADASSGTPGTLDRSFSGNGKVFVTIGSPDDDAYAEAIQPDGDIVLAGTANAGVSNENFGLVRLRPDGTKDGSFGRHGEVQTDLGGGQEEAFDVALQPDGRIVLVGWNANDMVIVRYLSDGRLDPTFGSGGVVTIDIGRYDQANAVAVDADERILVAGETSDGSVGRPVLARLLSDGSLDPTFGSNGLVVGGRRSGATFEDMALQRDGRIVVTEVQHPNVLVRRFLPDGRKDPSFGTKGAASTPLTQTAHVALALRPDGDIVTAATVPGQGEDQGDFGVYALRADGSADAAFGTGGLATVDFAGSLDQAYAVTVGPDGSVIAGGDANDAEQRVFAVARLLPDGSPDPAFGHNGRVTTGGGELGFVQDLALDASGRIVAAGVASPHGDLRFMALRFLG